jgi:hypothetical protein
MYEDGIKMDKRTRLLASLWILCLSTCLILLAGCNYQAPSLTATSSPTAHAQTSATVFAGGTPDILFNLIGTYAGTYLWHDSSSPAQLRLEIIGQESIQLSGFCTLGVQRYPLKEALVGTAFGSEEAVMTFTVDVPASQGQQPVSLIFSGSVTKEGVMKGSIIASDGRTGTWSAQKV